MRYHREITRTAYFVFFGIFMGLLSVSSNAVQNFRYGDATTGSSHSVQRAHHLRESPAPHAVITPETGFRSKLRTWRIFKVTGTRLIGIDRNRKKAPRGRGDTGVIAAGKNPRTFFSPQGFPAGQLPPPFRR